jgi:ankyrin repeat protein
LEIADILLDHGADINATSLHGRTSLHLIAMCVSANESSQQFSTAEALDQTPSERVQLATLLRQRGAKLEVYDDNRWTPFLAAVRAGNIDMARLLLESNCDSSAVDKVGGCALHIAGTHIRQRSDECTHVCGLWG